MELGEFDGLREELIHAGGQATRLLLRKGGSGKGYDREGGCFLVQWIGRGGPTAEASRGFPAIKDGHMAVQQHDVGQRLGVEGGEDGFAVPDESEGAAEAGELGGDDFLIYRIVFGDEHADGELGYCRRDG